MIAPSSPASTAMPPPSTAPESPELSVTIIERSCRIPVLVLLVAAGVWLACGAVFGLISAIKAHAPGFLANAGWLTYGRALPASNTALVYGFILQAGLGVGVWLLCRLGRNLLFGDWMITGMAVFWNIGLIIGLAGILGGGSTGYPWLEMPITSGPILFCAYVLLSAWALVTLHVRRRRTLYVSQWFLLLGLFWFPWVYSCAELLLLYMPVRGVMQAIVSGWFEHNLFELCLSSFGLATIFYLLPKLLNRPLHSRGLALFGFWFLVLFGGWGGLRRGDPAPNWLSSVSVVALVFVLLPVLAFGLSWYGTMARNPKAMRSDPILRFIWVGMTSYVLAALLQAMAALPEVSQITEFTVFTQGLAQLRIHGFLIMTLAGAIYYIGPRLTGWNSLSPSLMKLHFWSAAAGLVVSVAALLVGGLVQGAGIAEPQIPFLTVMRRAVPFLGTHTLGTMLLLIGYAAFVANLSRLLLTRQRYTEIWARVRSWPTVRRENP